MKEKQKVKRVKWHLHAMSQLSPKSQKKELRKLKMCKDVLLSDLVFNKERFNYLFEFEKVGLESCFVSLFLGLL